MLDDVKSIAVEQSSQNHRLHSAALRTTCLLCRTLFPIIVQHRHLALYHSSEAKTLFLTSKGTR